MRKYRLDNELERLGYMRLKSVTTPDFWCLYRKDATKGTRFVASFETGKNGKIVFNGKTYTDTEDFLKDAEEYSKTLFFDPDTYNPDYRKSYVDEIRLHDTIRESGLKEMKINGMYSASNYILEDDLGGKFAHVVCSGEKADLVISESSWISLLDKDDQVDENSCTKLKSILGSVYAYHICKLVDTLNGIGKMDMIDDIQIKTFNEHTLQFDTRSGKEGIIAKLEETLSKLKGNE